MRERIALVSPARETRTRSFRSTSYKTDAGEIPSLATRWQASVRNASQINAPEGSWSNVVAAESWWESLAQNQAIKGPASTMIGFIGPNRRGAPCWWRGPCLRRDPPRWFRAGHRPSFVRNCLEKPAQTRRWSGVRGLCPESFPRRVDGQCPYFKGLMIC